MPRNLIPGANHMPSTKLISTTLVALTLAALAGTAAADSKCSNVGIEVHNSFISPITNTSTRIKVVDFDYWDDEDNKWRDEVTDNKTISAGQSASWTKNLEYVGGEAGVKIKVYFKYEEPGNGLNGGWSETLTRTSTAFTCVDGMNKVITIQ